WVFQYALVDPARRASPLKLRRFQDDVLRPALSGVPGVAEVASVGGGVNQIVVEVRPDELRERGLAFTDLTSPLHSALTARSVKGLDELRALPIADPKGGEPFSLRDVAYVRETEDMPSGQVDLAGKYEVVGGIVIAERNADPSSLIAEVKSILDRK